MATFECKKGRHSYRSSKEIIVANEKEKAIVEAEKLGLEDNHYYHELLGYLYTDIDNQKAIAHYQKAVTLSKSPNERATLQKQIEQLVK